MLLLLSWRELGQLLLASLAWSLQHESNILFSIKRDAVSLPVSIDVVDAVDGSIDLDIIDLLLLLLLDHGADHGVHQLHHGLLL